MTGRHGVGLGLMKVLHVRFPLSCRKNEPRPRNSILVVVLGMSKVSSSNDGLLECLAARGKRVTEIKKHVARMLGVISTQAFFTVAVASYEQALMSWRDLVKGHG